LAIQKLSEGIYSIGVKDWSRRLFDELVPLPDGTSYNCYLIQGSEKTAMIDSVDIPKANILLNNLDKLGITSIDYVISNHAEQDHSGAIPEVLARFPEAKVVTNKKCKVFLQDHLNIVEEKFIIIEDNETLSLGDRTLQFIMTPWVHWPETMSTYLQEDEILFSCDFFGSHLATSNLFVRHEYRVLEDAKRYYAEIMMPFRLKIRKNIAKVEKLKLKYIAPSHGPVYNRPALIMDAYKDWVSDRVENMVVLPYISMHGSTEKMALYLTDALITRGVDVKVFNLSKTDLGKLAMALVDAATIVIGTSTVLSGPHPAAVYAATLINALKPKLKYAAVFGSYGWGGQAVEILQKNIDNLKVEYLEPLLFKGDPKEEDFRKLDELAEMIAEKHKGLSND
jgi:flavorubredoxin